MEWVIKKRERSKDEAAVKWAEEVIDLRAFCNGLIDEIRRNISGPFFFFFFGRIFFLVSFGR